VALAAAGTVPDIKTASPSQLPQFNSSSLNDSLALRQQNPANRSDTRGASITTTDQSAPDIWLLPLKSYTVSAPFGQRWGTLHPGVDLSAAEGTPFYAVHSGVIKLARYNGGYGNCVVLDLGNGVTIVYGHASRLLVHEGQRVSAGDVLGLVGNTGYSFGDHLHFEIRVNDGAVDPMPYMLAQGVDVAKGTDPLTS
jgi:murein DD-endopeptidase MepM/ murein hydrolase activator NlpD